MIDIKESTKTFGVKVPETLYTEANRLKDQFGTGEDFLNEVITAYKTEKVKEQIPLVATDITVLKTLTKKIFEIYLNLSYSIETISQSKEAESIEKLEKKDLIISNLQDEINQLNIEKEKFFIAFNNEKEDRESLEKQINQLIDTINSKNDTIVSNKDLIEEYKSKNDTLNGLLTRYEKFPSEIDTLNELIVKNDNQISSLLGELKEKDEKIKDFDESIKSINAKHKTDLQTAIEQQKFIMEKALLDKDKEHQLILNKVNNDNNNRINSLLNEKEKINNKISKLMEENQIKDKEMNVLDMRIKELIVKVENPKDKGSNKK